MRGVGTLLISAVLIAGITVPFYLICLKPGSPLSGENSGVVTAVETRSGIPEHYRSGNDLRQNERGGPNHLIDIDNAIKNTLGDPESMTASERKTLMYTIKTIHDPFSNAQ
jgi:hypothetical protein